MAKALPIPGLTADMRYSDAAVCTIEVRAAELFDHAAGVLDVSNIEAVHAMRVATRRLRSVLEFYEPCLDRDKLKPVLRQVCDLADALGQRRDPDVELEALAQFAAAATPSERPGIDRFVAKTSDQQMQANGELSEMLEQIERDDLRGRLRELTEPQPTATEVDSGQGEEDPGQATEAGEPPAKSGWLRRR